MRNVAECKCECYQVERVSDLMEFLIEEYDSITDNSELLDNTF